MSKIRISLSLLLVCLLAASTALASGKGRSYEVSITNLTKAQVFTEPVLFSHEEGYQLFMIGEPASLELAEVAEGGATASLEALLGTRDDVFDIQKSAFPILPGQTLTMTVQIKGKAKYLSLVGMLASSNDAVYAFRGVKAPRGGMEMLMLPAYDAGSEKNTELCDDLPGPPCNNGTNNRVPAGAEGFVHLHNGIHGIGGLFAPNMDWNNPVAKVLIKKMK